MNTEIVHKPESMHYGECPKCRRKRVAVLLYPKGDKTATRCHYLRRHKCGSRILPVAGSLQELSSSETTGSTT